VNPLTEETRNRALIVRGRYDLTVPERALIERGLLLADSLGKKEYACPILNARFVLMPAGTFMMGSPENEPDRCVDETLHQVTISKPFYMQTTEVTQGQWKKVMGGNPSCFKGDDNLPVEQVSWDDVQDFIERLNRQEGTVKYRLPTEAEWEYACRAGSTTAYCFGDDSGGLGEYAWYGDNSEDVTHPVGQKKPNAWGLYDMHGNVWEWVNDRYEDYSSGSVTDPESSSKGSDRVIRGGGWRYYAWSCRSAVRYNGPPDVRVNVLGFRLLSLSGHREIKSEVVTNEQVTSEKLKITSEKLKKLIRLGEEKGFITYDDLNDMLPSDVVSSDQIDDIIMFFIKKNIDIIDPDERETLIVNKPTTGETSRDRDFIAYNNGTVLDTRTNLMWAGEDNKFGINWADAESYCKNYRGGGYSDWRMPTLDELEELYKSENYENVIQITGWFVWASETRGSDAASFYFYDGSRDWYHQSNDSNGRALPVRSAK